MKKLVILIIFVGLFALAAQPVLADITISQSEFKGSLKKALFDFFENPDSPSVEVEKIKNMITIYLENNESEDIILTAIDESIYNTASALPVEIPRCSDGTEYGECSVNRPQYCWAGKLVGRCHRCKCPSGKTCNIHTKKCGVQTNITTTTTLEETTTTTIISNTTTTTIDSTTTTTLIGTCPGANLAEIDLEDISLTASDVDPGYSVNSYTSSIDIGVNHGFEEAIQHGYQIIDTDDDDTLIFRMQKYNNTSQSEQMFNIINTQHVREVLFNNNMIGEETFCHESLDYYTRNGKYYFICGFWFNKIYVDVQWITNEANYSTATEHLEKIYEKIMALCGITTTTTSTSTTITVPSGSCIDSDIDISPPIIGAKGNLYAVKGTCTDATGTYEDYCEGDMVHECYCTGVGSGYCNCQGGYICNFGCKDGACITLDPFCNDTDADYFGHIDYYEKGVCTDIGASGGLSIETYRDVCVVPLTDQVPGKYVQDYYCVTKWDGTEWINRCESAEFYACPQGCQYGTCLTENSSIPIMSDGTYCSDSDGHEFGLSDYSLKATCTDNSGTYEDFCDGVYVKEYHCGGIWDGYEYSNVSCRLGGAECANGCEDGACRASAPVECTGTSDNICPEYCHFWDDIDCCTDIGRYWLQNPWGYACYLNDYNPGCYPGVPCETIGDGCCPNWCALGGDVDC